MDDQTSWKGHSFTLLVFVGIVVLCSIFFILGMLVGRIQSGAGAPPATAESPASPEKSEDKPPEMTFYDSVSKPATAPLETPPEGPKPAPEPPVVKNDPPAAPAKTLTYQVAAMSKAADAEKMVRELKAKGFPAFILSPSPGDPVPLHRVQVGPLAENEVADMQVRLQDAGYKNLVVKR